MDLPTLQPGSDGLWRIWLPATGEWLGPWKDPGEAQDELRVQIGRARRGGRAAHPVPSTLTLSPTQARRAMRAEPVPTQTMLAPHAKAPNANVPYIHESADGYRVWLPTSGTFVGPYATKLDAQERLRTALDAMRPRRSAGRADDGPALFAAPPPAQRSLFGNPRHGRRASVSAPLAPRVRDLEAAVGALADSMAMIAASGERRQRSAGRALPAPKKRSAARHHGGRRAS